MPTVHRSTHFTIEHHPTSGYVRVIRSAAPFASLEAAKQAFADCREALDELPSTTTSILLDWRKAVLSTDAKLHQLIVESGDMLMGPFTRRALLVATSVGKLQAARLGRASVHTALQIFDDDEAATRHATMLVRPSRSPPQ